MKQELRNQSFRLIPFRIILQISVSVISLMVGGFQLWVNEMEKPTRCINWDDELGSLRPPFGPWQPTTSRNELGSTT